MFPGSPWAALLARPRWAGWVAVAVLSIGMLAQEGGVLAQEGDDADAAASQAPSEPDASEGAPGGAGSPSESGASGASGASGGPAGASGARETQAETQAPPPAPAGATDEPPNRIDIDEFIPSEEIGADEEVVFPVDI